MFDLNKKIVDRLEPDSHLESADIQDNHRTELDKMRDQAMMSQAISLHSIANSLVNIVNILSQMRARSRALPPQKSAPFNTGFDTGF